jgi:hypothetical protein
LGFLRPDWQMLSPKFDDHDMATLISRNDGEQTHLFREDTLARAVVVLQKYYGYDVAIDTVNITHDLVEQYYNEAKADRLVLEERSPAIDTFMLVFGVDNLDYGLETLGGQAIDSRFRAKVYERVGKVYGDDQKQEDAEPQIALARDMARMMSIDDSRLSFGGSADMDLSSP